MVAPEFVQHELDPSRVADTLERLLDPQSADRRTMIDALAGVRAQLGTPGAAARVADMALTMVR
jgi:lipid-A-disaccharide synthase